MRACGHSRRKPLLLRTNLRALKLLEGRCGSGKQGAEDYETLELDERMKASRSWAAWPADLKLEVVKGILLKVEHPVVSWLSKEECTPHHGAGRARAQRRIPSPDTYTLSLDLCGPFCPGQDLSRRADRKGKEVVGLVPGMDKVLSKEPGALELEVGEGELLPEVGGEDLPKMLKVTRQGLVEPEEVEVRNYAMVTSRHGGLGEDGGQVELPESPCPASWGRCAWCLRRRSCGPIRLGRLEGEWTR